MLCRLVINYRRFEHSHVVHERLGLLDPAEEGIAMFQKEETIYQSTRCHIPEDVYSTATSVWRNCRHADATRAVAYIRPPFTPWRRWPQHAHNTLSFFFFYLEWIPFCRQKAVFWIPATRSGSNFANNYTGHSVICSSVPDLKTSSNYQHDTNSVCPAIGQTSAPA